MNTHPRNRTKATSQTRVTTLVVDDSPFSQPARKEGDNTYDTMKTRTQDNTTQGKTKKTSGVPPTRDGTNKDTT